MTKQIQDAYIIAATRTPVGKAPRGAFKHTRPDSLLAQRGLARRLHHRHRDHVTKRRTPAALRYRSGEGWQRLRSGPHRRRSRASHPSVQP